MKTWQQQCCCWCDNVIAMGGLTGKESLTVILLVLISLTEKFGGIGRRWQMYRAVSDKKLTTQ